MEYGACSFKAQGLWDQISMWTFTLLAARVWVCLIQLPPILEAENKLSWSYRQWDSVLYQLSGKCTKYEQYTIIYQKEKAGLPPFQMSLKKETAIKTVKVWKVDSAWGALGRLTNNLLGSAPDKWWMLVLFDQNIALIWVVMASYCLVRNITQLLVLFDSSRCSVPCRALCFMSSSPHSVFTLLQSDFR